MLLGLIVGLAIVMFVAKVLLFALLFAIPVMAFYFIAKGIRHAMLEDRYEHYQSGYRQSLDPSWRRFGAEPLFHENDKPFEWLTVNRTIQVG